MALELLTHVWNDAYHSASFQDQARADTFKRWMETLVSFDNRILDSLNPEELKSIQEEKQIFLNKIGFDENLLYHFKRTCEDFLDKILCQKTEEGLMSVIKEVDHIFYGNSKTEIMNSIVAAVDKYILEKNKQKYTAPAA